MANILQLRMIKMVQRFTQPQNQINLIKNLELIKLNQDQNNMLFIHIVENV